MFCYFVLLCVHIWADGLIASAYRRENRHVQLLLSTGRAPLVQQIYCAFPRDIKENGDNPSM